MREQRRIDDLHEEAKRLWEERRDIETQKETTDIVNERRKELGLDEVTRTAVVRAVEIGGRRYVRLLCDIIEALGGTGRALREGGKPVLFVEWLGGKEGRGR